MIYFPSFFGKRKGRTVARVARVAGVARKCSQKFQELLENFPVARVAGVELLELLELPELPQLCANLPEFTRISRKARCYNARIKVGLRMVRFRERRAEV